MKSEPNRAVAQRLPLAASWGAILFALGLPSVLTSIYFVALEGHPAGAKQLAFTGGKAIQFLFPAFWVFVVEQRRLEWTSPTRRGLAFGIGMGAVVSGIMLGAYFGGLAQTVQMKNTAAHDTGKTVNICGPAPAAVMTG